MFPDAGSLLMTAPVDGLITVTGVPPGSTELTELFL